MTDGPNITTIAALIGDHARAQVLTVLMAGKALTATELADAASVTRQTISSHLARLVDAGLLAVDPQGRHRYFRIADAEVAGMLETLMGAASGADMPQRRTGPREPALRKARVCYDHLAGELGVLVYDRLVERGAFALGPEGIALTPQGAALVAELGIEGAAGAGGRRPFCRTCLDWSERRHHLAGMLGATLLGRFEGLGWARRVPESRVLAFSPAGEAALRTWLG
ncbi:ArsR/SmtB family transcription factor [Telluria aromaticivorans]|uniref:Winged helix-turn-helix transcriptional regulator n=1 Tax=Telluria aromaticivorans TaxID=2725995 RepID=A0A7Y2JYZ0_9BURK|nr:winged helix-turn-helix domain-containing protein [Telluria aromaticivorans]NNG23125.1 winged helix-turn-helix transcriptional regulator [Telluria aromaticivorans]